MALGSVYLNGGFIGVTRSYFSEVTTAETPTIVESGVIQGTGTTNFATTLQEGDVVVVGGNSDGTGANIGGISGYTTIVQNSTNSVSYYIAYKVMGPSPDISISGHNSSVQYVWAVVRGVDNTTVEDATATIDTATSGMPNSPAITTVTDNSMILTFGFLDDDNVEGSITAPTSYDLLAVEDDGGTSGTAMLASSLLISAGEANPAAFGGSGSDSWVGVTIALRRGLTTTQEYRSGIFNLQAVLESLST